MKNLNIILLAIAVLVPSLTMANKLSTTAFLTRKSGNAQVLLKTKDFSKWDDMHKQFLKEALETEEEVEHYMGDSSPMALDKQMIMTKLNMKATTGASGQTSHMRYLDYWRNKAERTTLLKAGWQPFRVKFNTDHFKVADSGADQHIKKNLLAPVAKAFSTLLKVRRNPNGVHMKLPAHHDRCVYLVLGKGFEMKEPNFDLILFATAEFMTGRHTNTIAWAGKCHQEKGSFRPNVGQVSFNLHKIKKTTVKSQLLGQIGTTLHEITHVLGFSGREVRNFQTANLESIPESKGLTLRNNQIRIHTPKVIAHAKVHFGCPTMKDVGFENGGGAGSGGAHWDRVEFGDETMTASSIDEQRYSKFTLAFLEDSGWYKPNYALADPFTFGKGKGCGFVNKLCKDTVKHKEFCNGKRGSYGCDDDGDYKEYCTMDQFSTPCSYWMGLSNGFIGDKDKKCFRVTDPRNKRDYPETLKFTCSSDKKSISVVYANRDKQKITCTVGGAKSHVITGFSVKYEFQCPDDIVKYCSPKQKTLCEKILDNDLKENEPTKPVTPTKPTKPTKPTNPGNGGTKPDPAKPTKPKPPAKEDETLLGSSKRDNLWDDSTDNDTFETYQLKRGTNGQGDKLHLEVTTHKNSKASPESDKAASCGGDCCDNRGCKGSWTDQKGEKWTSLTAVHIWEKK